MKFYRSILSLGFVALVFVSGSSFMVGLHFCGGKVQNIALFSKADGCDKEKQLPPCHRHETPPCCQDETVIHEGQDFKNSITQISFSAPLIAEVSVPVLISEVINSNTSSLNYTYYDPPLRTCDLVVSLQAFLI